MPNRHREQKRVEEEAFSHLFIDFSSSEPLNSPKKTPSCATPSTIGMLISFYPPRSVLFSFFFFWPKKKKDNICFLFDFFLIFFFSVCLFFTKWREIQRPLGSNPLVNCFDWLRRIYRRPVVNFHTRRHHQHVHRAARALSLSFVLTADDLNIKRLNKNPTRHIPFASY